MMTIMMMLKHLKNTFWNWRCKCRSFLCKEKIIIIRKRHNWFISCSNSIDCHTYANVMQKKNQQQIPLGIRSGESFWNLVLVSDFNKWKPAIGEKEWGEQKPVNLVIIMVLSVHWKRLQIMLLMMMPFPKNRRRKREKHLKRILSVQWLNNRDSLTLTCDTATATARDLFLSFFCFHCTLSRFIPFLLSSVVCFSRKKKIVNLWILCLLYCLFIKIRFSLLVIWQSGVCKKTK